MVPCTSKTGLISPSECTSESRNGTLPLPFVSATYTAILGWTAGKDIAEIAEKHPWSVMLLDPNSRVIVLQRTIATTYGSGISPPLGSAVEPESESSSVIWCFPERLIKYTTSAVHSLSPDPSKIDCIIPGWTGRFKQKTARVPILCTKEPRRCMASTSASDLLRRQDCQKSLERNRNRLSWLGCSMPGRVAGRTPPGPPTPCWRKTCTTWNGA